ncbi:uncharacterized protein [Haliotis cracherodii]|uniref:uncharacterized protein n=1 Tax=Haliotis cracherodii TaxID=6455 RepID=UPI0039E934BA
MVDVRLYSHAIWTHSRTPIYTDYYLTDKEIRAFNHRGRPWGGNRVWGLDVWRDLQERRRWTIASVPNWLLNINVNTREGTTRSSGNTPDINITTGHSHGIYLTNRIRRPCTVEIPYPFLNVNTRDGVFLHDERAKLERLGRRSPFSPAVIAIHLNLPDEEPFLKFKDLSNHLARVVEEPDDRGFFFWFIKRQRGQWNTPVKDSSLYFIDFNGKHLKYKIHAGDCIKFEVVISERNPLSSQSFSSTPSPTSQPRRSSMDKRHSSPSPAPSPATSPAPSPHPPHPPHPQRSHTRDRTVQTDRIITKTRQNQTRDENRSHTRDRTVQTDRIITKTLQNQTTEENRSHTRDITVQTDRIITKTLQNQTTEENRIQNHKQVQTSEPSIVVLDPTFYDDEVVLARWEDDRWYYKGKIVQRHDKDCYYVEDVTGRRDVISSKHIIRTTDHYDAGSTVKRDRVHVLAPHPVYYWSYAPGSVIEAIGQKLTVRFYDNNQTNIEKWNVYPARNREKHLKDVEDIRQREKDWEGKEAIIRDESGVYRPGRVNKQIGCQQRYTVTWPDGQCGEQMSIHIYGTYTKMIKFKVGSYILALVDSDSAHFLPGQVKKVTTCEDADVLDVVFIDDRRSKDALSTDSYWMNKMAYTEAKKVFLKHHPNSSDKEEVSR